jgi:predicted nucleic acid-binding protein
MDCVIDVSFVGCWFLEDESSAESYSVLSAYEEGHVCIHVPQLWNYEILNFLRNSCRRKRLAVEALEASATFLNRLKFNFHEQSSAVCRHRILSFATEFNLTAYDAAYLELADRLQIPLLTLDTDLENAAKKRNLPTSLKSSK